jgi:hypothetical protein
VTSGEQGSGQEAARLTGEGTTHRSSHDDDGSTP